jgi:Tol biopolymer transport system component
MRVNWKLGSLLASLLACVVSMNAGEPAVFSMPDSVLLFGFYNRLRVTTPDRVVATEPPVQVPANEGAFIPPRISPRGDLVAWGFVTEVREGLPALRSARYALGLYSLRAKTWKTFGDFDGIHSFAFSFDGSKIVFFAYQQDRLQMITFDTAKEIMTIAPYPKEVPQRAQMVSWSPNGKRAAIVVQRPGKESLVAVLDLATGNVQSLGEGSRPAWSPTGEWIAYFDPSGADCLVVHPDGSGSKVVRKLRQRWFSYRRFGQGDPVWSPDGKRLLLNEMKGDGDSIDVMLVDLETGRATRKAKNGLPVYGWASLSR